jgi:hypothetical protein
MLLVGINLSVMTAAVLLEFCVDRDRQRGVRSGNAELVEIVENERVGH